MTDPLILALDEDRLSDLHAEIDDLRAEVQAHRDGVGHLGGPWTIGASRWDIAAVLAGHPHDVGGTPVDYPLMPEKVVLAKAQELVRRRLIDGCACGCRGDFIATS